jgi:hypothetical protein
MDRCLVSVVTFLALFSSAVMAQEKDGRSSTVPITIYTEFESEHSAQLTESLKSELTAIMGPIGLQFEWRDLKAARGNEVAVELVVVSFKGKCAMQDVVPTQPESGALGWTHMSDGDVLPFSDVDCNRVRKLISNATQGASDSDREHRMGRALGRVVAHELYHIFANTTKHASCGVAKAFYTANELVSDSFQFDVKESRKLRQGKLRSLFDQYSHSYSGAAGGQ